MVAWRSGLSLFPQNLQWPQPKNAVAGNPAGSRGQDRRTHQRHGRGRPLDMKSGFHSVQQHPGKQIGEDHSDHAGKQAEPLNSTLKVRTMRIRERHSVFSTTASRMRRKRVEAMDEARMVTVDIQAMPCADAREAFAGLSGYYLDAHPDKAGPLREAMTTACAR